MQSDKHFFLRICIQNLNTIPYRIKRKVCKLSTYLSLNKRFDYIVENLYIFQYIYIFSAL
jgi:hypothetical protein